MAVSRSTVVIVLIALAVFTFGGYDYAQQSAAIDDAVSVEATVVESSVSPSGGGGTEYEVRVEYRYRYQGTEYRSDKLFPGYLGRLYETESKAQSVIEPYDSGATVTAYVDPAAPSEAFLKQQTTQSPLIFMLLGGFWMLWITLDAVGAQDPGQGTTLRSESEYEPTRYQTLFGIDRDTVNWISKRLIVAALIVLPVSLVGAVLLALSSGSAGTSTAPMMVELSDPIGLLFVTAFIAILLLIASLLLYTVWSFTEYRRLRERIPEPRPPSPFKHPTRLVTILTGDDDLDDYGRRVKRTGFTFVLALFFSGALLGVLVF
ncbi:DUF3592 domain-containing protein [Halocatena salina]|uniref:DUF3592 domain-containing protein n=1 Tax=Halocatena salina TaxID=2934340 RepID=A0A8U0A1J6_9EURY|nr:DUF3592 domain-containing protein [Halocatena salina]UPM43015.1 DUF3592 domain-containing protein [Halocatena salina]